MLNNILSQSRTKYMGLILLLIMLTGSICDPAASDYRVGTRGVSMSFGSNSPPDKVFTNSPVSIVVNIKNEGAYDIKEGDGFLGFIMPDDYIYFFGKDEQYSTLLFPFDLYGRSQIASDGQTLPAAFSAKSRDLNQVSREDKDVTVIARLCYNYETVLSTDVCVDSDIYNIKRISKACTARERVFTAGQGAPVAIRKVVPTTDIVSTDNGQEVYPQFKIYITNMAKVEGAQVFNNKEISPIDACTIIPARTCGADPDLGILVQDCIWDIINIKAAMSGQQLDCQLGLMKLVNEESYATCTAKEPMKENIPAYTAELQVNLTYGIRQVYTKTVTVTKSLNNAQPAG
jgi:hypothetical protein